MGAELLQFAAVIGAFIVAALLWLRIVFIPGRLGALGLSLDAGLLRFSSPSPGRTFGC